MIADPVADQGSPDAAERLENLKDTADLLWNTSSRVTRRRRGADVRLLVVPTAGRPRLAVPAGRARAAATAVLAHGDSDTRAAQIQRRLLAWLLRCGAGRWAIRTGLELTAPPGPNVLAHLATILDEPLSTSMALTPRRANRKPVLHLLDRRGRSVAFAKIGVTDLTRDLVRHEAEVLRYLAGCRLQTLTPPTVVHAGSWKEFELLVLAPLPTHRARAATRAALGTAMRELTDLPLPDDADRLAIHYVESLRSRADAVRADMADDAARALLADVLDSLGALANDPALAEIPVGWWHGDWTPWNCREDQGHVFVWDWERCAPGVPVGFDAAHHFIQTLAVRDVPRETAATECVTRAAEVLAPWNLDEARARIVVGLYLAEIAVRYLGDAQQRVGGPGGDVGAWAIPTLRTLATSGRLRSDAD